MLQLERRSTHLPNFPRKDFCRSLAVLSLALYFQAPLEFASTCYPSHSQHLTFNTKNPSPDTIHHCPPFQTLQDASHPLPQFS
jgi:hypothetical protein